MKLSKSAVNHLSLFNDLKKQPEDKPSPLSVNEADIPAELKEINRWVCWNYLFKKGNWTKVPLRADVASGGDCNDPANHRSFEEVWLRYSSSDFSGIGFVLTNEDDLLGVDCDKCIEGVNDSDEIILSSSGQKFAEFWSNLGAYLEISPSGKGLRGFLRGRLPDDTRKKTDVEGSSWEIYEDKRYLTVTGVSLGENQKTIPKVSLDDLCKYRDEFMGSSSKSTKSGAKRRGPKVPGKPRVVEGSLSTEDKQKITLQCEMSASFKALWGGDWEDLDGEDGRPKYGSHSEADLGLCSKLAKLFDDQEKVEIAWSCSELWRPEKCEGRDDYVTRTIEKAFEQSEDRPGIQFLVVSNRDGESRLQNIAPSKAAEAFLKDNDGKLIYVDSKFYEYKQKTGIWSPVDEHVITSRVQHFLENAVEPYQPTAALSDKTVNDTVKFLSRSKEVARDNQTHVWNANPQVLVVGNGLIDLGKDKLTVQQNFDQTLHATVRSPIILSGGYECPHWNTFLEHVVPNPFDRTRVQEWAGYFLYPSTKLEKLLFLYGSGRNGKSTFIEVLTSLFDPIEISHVEPHNFVREYDVAALQHKRINVVTDITTDKSTSGMFKQLVSGERVKARNPYGKPFSFTPNVKFLFSSNFLPQTHDRSEGFYRRWDILKFSRQLKESEVDLELKNKLKKELPGILVWALEGLQRLKKSNWVMTDAPGFNHGIKSLRQYTDPISEFLEQSYVRTPIILGNTRDGHYVCWKSLYSKYVRYCEDNGLSKLGGPKLAQELERLGFPKKQKRTGSGKDGTGTGRAYVVFGLQEVGNEISEALDKLFAA